MSQQPKISKGTRVVFKGPNAHFGRVAESHTTQANTQFVLMDGSRNPTVFAAPSFAIAEDGVGCSPSTRAARAVTNGGPGDEEAEDPAPTAEGEDSLDDSSEDEKPAPEDNGDEHQAKRQACLARLGALVGSQIQVCMFSLPNPPLPGERPRETAET
jgi:hypothetical protein